MTNLKAKSGNTVCTLEELCFPVELIDNPNPTNREYSKIVRGQVPLRVPLSDEEQEEFVTNALDMQEIDAAINGEEFIPTKVVAPKNKTVLTTMDLNYCSPIYELIPNSEIFPRVVEILERHGIDYTAEFSHTNHARFYGNFTIEDKRFSYFMNDGKDEIKFRWNFQHSYNGLTKYKGIAGFFRLVCTNGLTIPVQEMNEYNLCVEGKHTGSIIRSLEMFNDVIERVVNNVGDITTSIVSKYKLLGGTIVENPKERIEAVLKASKIVPIANKSINTVEIINSMVLREANDDTLGYNGQVNDWLIYNGINAYIYDERTITAPEIRRDKDSRVLESMLKDNAAKELELV